MTVKIERESQHGQSQYEHLKPLVIALIAGSNKPSISHGGHPPDDLGFYMTQGGWLCDLMYPIDFDLIIREFEIPKSIKLNKDNDTIFCEGSWIQIRGNIK